MCDGVELGDAHKVADVETCNRTTSNPYQAVALVVVPHDGDDLLYEVEVAGEALVELLADAPDLFELYVDAFRVLWCGLLVFFCKTCGDEVE